MDMSWKLLDQITSGFCEEIGRGTFGVVYKGKDQDGQEIAVKVLRDQDLGGNAFKKEFNNLTKLKHPNIVRLVGFCDEDEPVVTEYNGKEVTAIMPHRALCFEYLHNGSLQKHLSDEHQGLDWQKRYIIIKGICMGLKYLHTGLESPVQHFDLKPDNILLDDNMVPKIADFGLSRLLLGEETSKKTLSVLGTLGYCPPEFITQQIISKEFDIFSLGVIIIKIICGPAAHSPGDDKTRKFIRQVHKKWRKRLIIAIPGYQPIDIDCQCEQVKKCIEIALKCTIEDRQRRPNIGYIVDQLAETEKSTYDKANSMNESHGSTLSLPTNMRAVFLKAITLDFATERKLGGSVFGTVYKGILPTGGVISVKRLDENEPVRAAITFETEVKNLMALKHKNIVQLVGFCHEAQKKVIQHRGKYVIVDAIESCLCYEYLAKGSLEKQLYVHTSSIDWDTRFKIIKGICQGLHFLHKELDRPLVHMSLVPNSIWFDDNWVPKLANFGLSRLFGQEQTRMYTINVMGQNGYMAPEYLYRGEISTMSDIYSLGMLIMEITTRENCAVYDSEDKAARKFVDNVQENWKTDEQIIYRYPLLDANGLQQVKACILIAMKCVEPDRNKRPSIVDIVDKLNGKRMLIFDQIRADSSSPDEITPTSSVQLYVDPPQLRFPFKQNKSFSCPLRLINRTDDYVAAKLLTNNPKRYVAATLLCGVVPPRSTYTLVVTMKGHEQLLADEVLSLESCIVHKGVNVENADLHSVGITLFKNIFKEAKGLGADNVHEHKLKVVFDLPKEATFDQPFQYEIEIISNKKFSQVLCVEVHPVEPWIMTSHQGGDIYIWDYQEQEIESCFDFTQRPVSSVKFIEQEECLVAGDGDGIIYVYSYDTDEKVTSIEAHEGNIRSLVVHPTDPLVLSSSDDHLIKIWDWEKGWECIRTLEGHSDTVMQVVFNPVDTDSFASASLDQTIKIWNISSSECKKTLSDHLVELPCVLTYTGDTGQCLVTGSSDGTTQIWDLETETCVQTLEGHTDRISSVYRHPELPLLLTGSHDGTVRTWNSDTYRLEDIFGIKLGAVFAFGYIKSVERVVVACRQGIAIMEMK
ncbi:receptor like protein kinase S.2-like isoform X3 [Miscanthus floridulus]|uniref:receptor like protein kinase S.2-like isoform X3 n=1 Tax=Miscanthus floridulus TaxID=154761 RepID=UPI00345B026F